MASSNYASITLQPSSSQSSFDDYERRARPSRLEVEARLCWRQRPNRSRQDSLSRGGTCMTEKMDPADVAAKVRAERQNLGFAVVGHGGSLACAVVNDRATIAARARAFVPAETDLPFTPAMSDNLLEVGPFPPHRPDCSCCEKNDAGGGPERVRPSGWNVTASSGPLHRMAWSR